ncbi:PREDICTED: late histone H1-like [Trachymyrmex cornetzi]|uniref:Histone H1 n=1 Tax=Trachymyrmex cornetzi TaxID=471704 RepID=A0A195D9V8_9HYME|nr:PREDICTED: late histone H1-like [Trachymyrmex cornetzi]KYN09705.1 Histone H1 [Trachymyrmex cornetzi]
MEDKVSGNTAVETAESNAAVTKKASKSKVKSQQKKTSARPPTSEMVTAAIKQLKDRKGSSFQAIKKYIVSTYKVDGEKVAPFIKRYLKSAVTAGAVVQTKGKGATGSFKLSTDKPKPTKSKGKAQRALGNSDVWKASTKKDAQTEKAPRKPAVAKKTTTAKRAATSPKKPVAQKAVAKTAGKKGKAATEPKSPSKAKKAVKAPAAKTKTPKPKKATGKAVKAAAKK